ncbi:CubicO group peptidase, beta-lactamase class C family [Lentzea xinjiangensis]|uniref:CubicO group peptidase, beta-lactamase class C family n=1 Tax=Lentzea xinjiangensis TaxID=402600 RepID=A0A1H9F1S3_9PSEU|nr:serine hydrolase domain-containing protein [Lentzea xinjiangensis]SEQ31855.1 CubicO group peptidase, beta-lactamase class C family [Lentzea xinjiangensis]
MLIPALALAVVTAAVPGHFDRPQEGFAHPWTTLRESNPYWAGLDPTPVNAALRQLRDFTKPQANGKPLYAGAVTMYVHDGKIVAHDRTGYAVLYGDRQTLLPEEERVPMRKDTIFDFASISKLFTSIAVIQQVEKGRVDIDEKVAAYLPEFGVNGKENITVKQLLTHTSGLEPFIPLWQRYPDIPSRVKAVMDVQPKSTPGTTYVYSDLNLITLGELVHRVSGKRLDQAVRDGITTPLGMKDTGYNPTADDRTAATEFQSTPPRGIVRGEVHDENAWSLGGVAGHAGVFGTAKDLAILGQTILNGGTYQGRRILSERSVELMLTNFTPQFPDNAHGLGFELDQRWYMGALSSPGTAGHTGYTGTSFVVDKASRSIAILLTNRVHPSRDWGSVNPARRVAADGLAGALAVKAGGKQWRATASGGTLTAERPAEVFVDVDKGDRLTVQHWNGTGWQDVRTITTTNRRWVSTEPVKTRFVYTKAGQYNGRGVYVHARGDVTADGWSLARR